MTRPSPSPAGPAGAAWLLALPGTLLLVALSRMCWGYVKDDAWISFRYARNLAWGDGLVFNVGEPIEGYTNFLWTVVMAPLAGAGMDPLPWAALLGLALTTVALWATVAMVRELGGSWWEAALAGVAYAAWPTVPNWAIGGLEMGMVQAWSALGLWATLRAWRTHAGRDWAIAGLLLALGCLTRPDSHAVAALALGAALLCRPRESLPGIGVLLGITAPYHLWRLLTFGSLLPNTFKVKGGSGFQYWEWGLRFVQEMALFTHMWILLALALLAGGLALWRGRRDRVLPTLVLLALPLVFILYMVKVGADELRWYRLFLPAWPAVIALAGTAGRRLVEASSHRALALLPAAAILVFVGLALRYDLDELPTRDTYVDSSRHNQADLGKFLTRHSEPGEWVVYQDMGSTPFHAPDLSFVDCFGLVDAFVADLYQRYAVNPFLKDYYRATPQGRQHLSELYAEGRAYLAGRDADWVIYVGRTSADQGRELKAAFRKAPDINPVDSDLRRLTFYFNWAGEPDFRERYEYVRTWRRSSTYWLTLWRRRDHQRQPPAEVVYDQAPTGLGPPLELADGTRFLGGTVEAQAWVADELWVETWLAPDGPGRPGTLVDLRFRKAGRDEDAWRESHVPGDWMWPAERWEAGQIVRDRVLLPIPAHLPPGSYDVAWRLRHRPSDRPIQAPGLSDGWVPVGSVQLERRPWYDLTAITPTDLDEQRAAPTPGPHPALSLQPRAGPVLAVAGDLSLGRRQNAITGAKGPADALSAVPSLAMAELAYANLESVVATGGISGVDKGERGPYYYRGRPELLEILRLGGVDVVGTANNHSGDYGAPALLEQADLLDAMGMAHVGTGADRDAACAPTYRKVGDVDVAFLAVDATKEHYGAAEDQPGTCFLDLTAPEDWRDHLQPRVAAARQRADLVMLGVHWGDNWQAQPSAAMRRAAQVAIEAGVDAVLGSSSHLLQGVEIIDGRPVLYDTGNLLFDSRSLGEGEVGAVFELVLSKGGVIQVRAVPIDIGFGATTEVHGTQAQASLHRLWRASGALGTPVAIEGGRALIDLPPPPERPAPSQALPPNPTLRPATAPTAPPAACTVSAVPPDAAIDPVPFGPLSLVGVKVHNPQIDGRAMLWVESFWTTSRALTDDLWLYQRVVPQDEGGELWWGDHEPCDWAWPSSRMVPGTIYRDYFGIRPPNPLPKGRYQLVFGVRAGRTVVGEDIELDQIDVR